MIQSMPRAVCFADVVLPTHFEVRVCPLQPEDWAGKVYNSPNANPAGVELIQNPNGPIQCSYLPPAYAGSSYNLFWPMSGQQIGQVVPTHPTIVSIYEELEYQYGSHTTIFLTRHPQRMRLASMSPVTCEASRCLPCAGASNSLYGTLVGRCGIARCGSTTTKVSDVTWSSKLPLLCTPLCKPRMCVCMCVHWGFLFASAHAEKHETLDTKCRDQGDSVRSRLFRQAACPRG